MSNPRLIAQDIAEHYEERCNKHLPHAKNVRRYLRKPVLAITRRILCPRMNYENDATFVFNKVGNEPFGEKTTVDPTLKGNEGLDWRDYLNVDKNGNVVVGNSRRSGSVPNANSMDLDLDTDLSFSETETETEDERNARRGTSIYKNSTGEDDTRHHPNHITLDMNMNMNTPLKTMKLGRRTLARMEAFLASCAYALPNAATSARAVHKRNNQLKLPVNVKSVVPKLKNLVSIIPGSNHFKTDLSLSPDIAQSPARKPKSDQSTIRTYPQMHKNDLILRLELYIRTLRRIYAIFNPKDDTTTNTDESCPTTITKRNAVDECVIRLEPPRALKTRINFLINSLISTVGSVGSMRPILNNLLVHFTREMLAVEFISEDLQTYIRKLVLEYDHLTSFASLAFLSTPEDSAETQLAPLLSKYVDYLQGDWKKCVWECRLEGTLARAIDPAIRKMFKTVEFLSIGHLLDVCHQHRDALENIVISSKIFDPSEEVGMYDSTTGNVSSGAGEGPGQSILSSASFDKNPMELCNNAKVIKQSLRDLRRETIIVNGQILPPVQNLKQLVALLRERLNSRPVRFKEKKVGRTTHKTRSKSDADAGESETSDGISSINDDSDTDFISSGNEGDGEETPQKSCRKKIHDSSENGPGERAPGKRKKFNVDAIDILTRRLLIAASRTRGGGDAYFVVQDLFGGEGVQVVPAMIQPHGPYVAGSISPTIELTVRLASITIKCHSMFDVYPENVHEDSEPFIQLNTFTTETIELQEVRIDDNGLELEISPGKGSVKPTKVMLKEKAGELSGRRVLAIKPAKYERVDNWHTPS